MWTIYVGERGEGVRIRDGWNSLVAWRAFTTAKAGADNGFRHLSSGLRIDRAADDASGLGMSQRILGQVKGLIQANRNVQDGVSMIQTVDGALQEIDALLQRGRQLSVQAANGTLTTADREIVQQEIDNVLSSINQISDNTDFNGRSLLSTTGNSAAVAAAINGLRTGWLEQAANVIQTFYGLVGDGSPLSIILESTGGQPAWVTGTPGAGGKWDDLAIHINLADFGSVAGPDGGPGPVYNDRKVAGALTKAILARNSNFVSLEDWFIDGVAGLISGRDEQLDADATTYGLAAVVNAVSTPWANDSLHQSSAYLAVKYLGTLLPPSTYQDVMSQLSMGNSLDSALQATAGVDLATFDALFQANGAAFFGTLNLADPDVGGINPGDASAVIPNGGTYSLNPVSSMVIQWPASVAGAQKVDIQLLIGANETDTLRFTMPEVTSLNLNLIGVDVVSRAQEAIGLFDTAINILSSSRGDLGSLQNRLEHAMAANAVIRQEEQASLSRIVDLDYAQEMTTVAKHQILVSSSSAMLAQANTLRQNVLLLLDGLSLMNDGGMKRSQAPA